MTRVILIGILLILFESVYSQSNILKEHTWKLEELSLDGVVYDLPENNEIDYIFLKISDSTSEENGYFGSTICNYLFGNVLISDNSFFFTTHSNSDLECQLDENNTFDELYFQEFFVNNINSTFEYSFNQVNNWLYLTITNINLDTVKYSVYLNETLTNTVWTLNRLLINQQEIYPPQELEGIVELIFPDNATDVISSVCDTFAASLFVAESTLINSGGTLTDIICEYEDFDNIYIESFLGSWLDNPVYQYEITTDTENMILTLTDHLGNQAFYYAENMSVIDHQNLNIQIFPNPAVDKIFIKRNFSEKSKVQIFNASGKLLIDEEINQGANFKELNVSQLPQGVYFFKIFNQQKKNTYSQKIIIK